MDIEMLRARARVMHLARAFFDELGYLELDTPILAPDLIPESCLEVFETRRRLPGGGDLPYWLVPSPEVWMKKIIARHGESVYQICKCFRNGESSGHLHSPEFTMLEYYTVGADYLDSIALTEDFVAFLARACDCRDFRPPFERLTVAEAFARHAGFDLSHAASVEGELAERARALGLDPPPGAEIPALFDLIFIHAVEPCLKNQGPVALLDYPAFVPCLARLGADSKTVERWELYHAGVELANCFSEETSGERVRAFF
ncbi:MAG: LysR family transcriptional regulator, partial [Treponema sp.]|nr:LysR family transcriptional regulator [Treponema sp.]